MSAWNDPAEWQALVDGSACPICRRGAPMSIIATLEGSWLTMPQKAPMPGYLCLVAKGHAVELHDMGEGDAERFMREARHVSRALSIATQAVKLNYEIHGNTLPHLHLHLFPRHRGDRFEGRPIDPRGVPQPVYAEGEYDAMRTRILQAMSEP